MILALRRERNQAKTQGMATPKGDSTKPQEVKEVALLCRKLLFMAEEVISNSSRKFSVFVSTFGLDQVDPSLKGPLGFED